MRRIRNGDNRNNPCHRYIIRYRFQRRWSANEMKEGTWQLMGTWLRLLGILCLALPAGPAMTQQGSASEQTVHAALVFNFMKFTEWPVAEGSLKLCVASGDRQQIEALENLAGKQVRGQVLVVARLHPRETNCQVLFVDSRQRWEESLGNRRSLVQTLTVGAYAGFAWDGGMIEIARHEGSARFDVNLAEVRRAGLRLYPQLLRLARQVFE